MRVKEIVEMASGILSCIPHCYEYNSNIKSNNIISSIIYACYPDYDMVRPKVNSISLIFNTNLTLHKCVKICCYLYITNQINTVLNYMRLKDIVINLFCIKSDDKW